MASFPLSLLGRELISKHYQWEKCCIFQKVLDGREMCHVRKLSEGETLEKLGLLEGGKELCSVTFVWLFYDISSSSS